MLSSASESVHIVMSNFGTQVFLLVRKTLIRKFWAHSAIVNPQMSDVSPVRNSQIRKFVMINPQIRKSASLQKKQCLIMLDK
jgi:hypothetical protein